MVESQAFQRRLAVYFSNRFLRSNRGLAAFAVAPVMALLAVVAGPGERRHTEARIVTSSMMAPLPTPGATPPMKGQVPQAILDPIPKAAAASAEVARDRLVDCAGRIGALERRIPAPNQARHDVHASSG